MEFNDEFLEIITNSLNGVGGFNNNEFAQTPYQMWQVIIPMPGMMMLIDREILKQYLLEEGDEHGEETF